MSRTHSIVIALAFVVGITASAQAQTIGCPYDIVGNSVLTAPYSFSPDGYVTFNRTNWFEDDVYACYYTHTYPGYYQYFPGCDLDGNGTVVMDEVYEIYFFVLDYPYPGSAASHAYFCPTCNDLSGVDFMAGTGDPQLLGAAVIGEECEAIFGNQIPPYKGLYANIAECIAACTGCATNDDCAEGKYCKFEDFVCGSAGLGTCEDLGEICAAIYDPVCTCDYQIVSSACRATVVGASIVEDAECAPEDVCNYNDGTWNGTECDCHEDRIWDWMLGCETPEDTCYKHGGIWQGTDCLCPPSSGWDPQYGCVDQRR